MLLPNKKPAGAYRASGPMSANFDALLKPPRARSYAVMVVMTVVSRGEIHSEAEYTGGRDSSQGRNVKILVFCMLPSPPNRKNREGDKVETNNDNRIRIIRAPVVLDEIHLPNEGANDYR